MTDTFDFDAKAGNRAGRRLRRALGNIGQSIGRGIVRQEPFDPKAEDGDGDGLVQDGSIWERPTGTALRSVSLTGGMGGDDDTGAIPSTAPDDGADVTTDSGTVAETKEALPYDPTDRRSLIGLTPEQIAERIVPDNALDAFEQRVAFLVGPPSQYPDQRTYEQAVREAEDLVSRYDEYFSRPAEALGDLYIDAYGAEAWERDAIDDPAIYAERLEELFGTGNLTPQQYANRSFLEQRGAKHALNLNDGQNVSDEDFSPETIALLRKNLAETLRRNPAFLETVQKFGSPPVVANHPRVSGRIFDEDGEGHWAAAIIGIMGQPGGYIRGFYDRARPSITVDGSQLRDYERRGRIDLGVKVSDPDVAVTLGFDGLFAHEYGHYVSHMMKLAMAQLLRALKNNGAISTRDRDLLEREYEIGFPGQDSNGNRTFAPFRAFYGRAIGRQVFNLDDPTEQGFSDLADLYNSLTQWLDAFYIDTDGIRLRNTAGSNSSLIKKVAGMFKSADRVYHNSYYSSTSTEERWAESFSAALLELGNSRYPVFINNFTVQEIAKILKMNTRPNHVRRITRRNKVTGKEEDITSHQLSDIRIIHSANERTPDGRQLDRAFMVDTTSRSTLRSARSNLGLDTDARLYDFDEPVTISDYRNRSRAYSIGDHRFYDNLTPNAHTIGSRRREIRGRLAGQRYINGRDNNFSDMVRGVSSTLMGFFVDDMPLTGKETEDDLAMLRGFVTGEIADLPLQAKQRIEQAVKDAITISEAIQLQPQGKKTLYRTIDVAPDTMESSLAVGDTFPLAITAFTDAKPGRGSRVVLEIASGSKSLDVGNGEFLTQGNYIVRDIADDGERLTVRVEHVETFDPRHDAMRPVDRFSDNPGAMRKRGSNKRRYTRAEQSLMEADLKRRQTINQRDTERIDTVLRSTRTLDNLSPKDKVRALLGTDDPALVDTAVEVSPELRNSVLTKAKDFIAKKVSERLDRAKERIMSRYGDETPWREDREVIRKFTRLTSSQIDSLNNGLEEIVRDFVAKEHPDWIAPGPVVIDKQHRYTIKELDQILNGEWTTTVWLKGGSEKLVRNDKNQLETVYVDPPGGRTRTVTAKFLLSDEHRGTLTTLRDALKAAQRMYGHTYDDSGEDNPDNHFTLNDRFKLSIKVRTLDVQLYNGEAEISAMGMANSVANATGKSSMVARFTRRIRTDRFNPGVLDVEHAIFDNVEDDVFSGLATLFNQHAFLWYQQAETANVKLTPADDGVLVWPRLGFRSSDVELELLERFAAEQLDNWVTGDESAIPTEDMALRVAAWVNLRRSGDKRADINLLASMIDLKYRETDDPNFNVAEARESWKGAFNSAVYGGRLDMTISAEGDNDFDNDYLPSYVITDEPEKFVRDAKIASEWSDGQPRRYASMDVTDKQTASRLALIGELTDGDSSARRSAIFDQSGYNGVPLIVTPDNLIKISQERGRRTGFPERRFSLVIVANGDAEEIRRFTFGERELDGIDIRFTTQPLSTPEKFATRDILSDPATEKRAVLAVTREGAVVAQSEILDGARNIIDDINDLEDNEAIRQFIGYKRAETAIDQRNRIFKFSDTFNEKYPKQAGRYQAAQLLKMWADLEDQKFINPKNDRERSHNSRIESAQSVILDTSKDTMEVILGVDIVRESNGSTRVLNRMALMVVDEPMSLAQIARIIDESEFDDITKSRLTGPITAKRSDRFSADPDWWKGDEPTLLRVFGDEPTSPIQVDKTTLRSQSFVRAVRQDFGIDLDKRGLRSSRTGGSTERRVQRRKGRTVSDNGVRRYEWDKEQDPQDWVEQTKDLRDEFNDITNRIDELENEQNALGDREQERFDLLESQIDELRERQDEIIDEFASMADTSNEVLTKALRNEAAIQALQKFLKEAAPDLPEEYTRRAEALLDELLFLKESDPLNYNGERGSIARKRHSLLSRILNDNFDLRWGVEHTPSDDIDPVFLEYIDRGAEGGALGSVFADELEGITEDIEELIYRGFFDPNFDRWDKRYGDIDFMEGKYQDLADLLKRRGIEYDENHRFETDRLLRSLFEGVSRAQRKEWAKNHDDFLNDQYNADYEETLIDATPSGPSPRPNGVPEESWRKIRAAIERAKRTPFDGERDASYEGAKRILARHRPDLANDDFVVSLRSQRSTGNMISGAPTFMAETRGASPDTPRRPKSKQLMTRVVDRMNKKGFAFKESDLYDKYIFTYMRKHLFAYDTSSTDAKRRELIDEAKWPQAEREIMLGFLETLAEIAVEDGFEVIKIEGHQVPKVIGPVLNEMMDVLMDDADIAAFRALGAPTYEQIVNIIAYKLRRTHQLDKMFGSGEKQDIDGNFVRTTGEYRAFLRRSGVVNGDYHEFRDERGNLVMRVSLDIQKAAKGSVDPSNYDLLTTIYGYGDRAATLTGYDVLEIVRGTRVAAATHGFNQTVIELMREELGMEPVVSSYPRPTSLAVHRQNLAFSNERISYMEFAPTPAGRHMRSLVEGVQQKQLRMLEIQEKIAKRQVALWRQSGMSDEEIIKAYMKPVELEYFSGEMVTDGQVRTPVYNLGSAIQERGEGSSTADMAFDSFARIVLNAGLPLITDANEGNAGFATHELAHFGLGQAFTRHGEFVANFWKYALYGEAYWDDFASAQDVQKTFDAYTVFEHFGKKLTKAQIAELPQKEQLELQYGKYADFTEADALQMNSDVEAAINAMDDLSDIEKAELLTRFRTQLPNNQILMYGRRTNRISEYQYDPYVPLPAHLFGWNRATMSQVANTNIPTPSSDLSPARRQQFSQMLQTLLQLRGRTRFFGDETQEDMVLTERAAKAREAIAKIQGVGITEGLKRMLDVYPELRDDFGPQLEELGL